MQTSDTRFRVIIIMSFNVCSMEIGYQDLFIELSQTGNMTIAIN